MPEGVTFRSAAIQTGSIRSTYTRLADNWVSKEAYTAMYFSCSACIHR